MHITSSLLWRSFDSSWEERLAMDGERLQPNWACTRQRGSTGNFRTARLVILVLLRPGCSGSGLKVTYRRMWSAMLTAPKALNYFFTKAILPSEGCLVRLFTKWPSIHVGRRTGVSSLKVWNSPVKPSGPRLFFVGRFLIIDSISLLCIYSDFLFLQDLVLVGFVFLGISTSPGYPICWRTIVYSTLL